MAEEVGAAAVLLNEKTLTEYVNQNSIGSGCYAFQMKEDGEALVLDSIDKLASETGYRCLAIAAKKFRQKLAHGLAAVYAHEDKPNTDHEEVLLGLKGGAYIKTSTHDLTTPAYCNLAGIHFNVELLNASAWYLQDRDDLDSEDAILNDRHGAAYVAILELSITHEFGHMKLHNELDDNHNTAKTWDETANISELIQQSELQAADQYPLYSEAGYFIEARIRETFFDEQVPAADRPQTEEGGRGWRRSPQAAQQEPPTSIHLLQAITKRGPKSHNPFRSLTVRHVIYKPLRGTTPYQSVTPDPHENGMSLEEIQNFMNYALPDSDEDDEDGGVGSGGGGGTGGDGGSDKKDEDGGGGGSRKRKRGASGGKSNNANAWARGSREKYVKIEDEEMEYRVEPENYNPKCDVSLRICDEEGKDKYEFLPTEDMFVDVRAFNYSNAPRHIDLKKGTFAFSGRGGHSIRIKCIKNKYTPSESLYDYELVTINPGEERTFNTKFAIGLLQRKDRDWCGVLTPTEAGEYEAGFYVNPRSDVCLGSARFRIKKFDIAESGLRRDPLMGYYYYP